jgi:DNA-binding NtrC family response regulator
MLTNQVKILVVDDEEVVRDSLQELLSEEGYLVGKASDGLKAVEMLKDEEWHILLVDMRMPGLDGLSLLKTVNQLQPHSAVVIMTAYATIGTAVESMKQGAYDYLVKPFNPEELCLTVKRILAHQRLLRENLYLRGKLKQSYQFFDLVSKNHRMREIFQLIKTIALSKSTILITGESGTGKELVAKAIHASSPRKNDPFISISCAALPETLLESELFGYEKGAFTGAGSMRKGQFELADGGTLFLDEIGEISPRSQVDLLRVIQEREIRRLGGTQPIKVDVRIISATNRDLARMVKEGTFRDDLYYRLNVISMSLPPLRDRKEDIPILVEHFIKKYNIENTKEIKGLTGEALKLLIDYDWPGNVRELENTVEHSVVVETREMIGVESLPLFLHRRKEEYIPSTEKRTIEEVECDHILKILKETNYNIKRSSEILGIDRSTLYNKMKRYRIVPPHKEAGASA